MADYLGEYNIDDYLPIVVATHRFDTGAATNASTLTYSVYKAGSTTGLFEGTDMVPGTPFDAVTGTYYVRLQLSAANGFVVNTDYGGFVKAIVNGVTGYWPFTFRIKDVLATSSDIASAILVDGTKKILTDASGNVSLPWPTGSVVADAGNTASTFKTDRTETANNYWKDSFVKLTSGTMSGQVKQVTAYDGTSKFITVAGGFTAAPAAAVTFVLVNI